MLDADADADAEVDLAGVNVMTMDFGSRPTSMLDASIAAAEATHAAGRPLREHRRGDRLADPLAPDRRDADDRPE
jgi:hypothetical protein